ncbi:MAG: holo-ACP synthase [Anaerotardibacter sp.]
MAFIEDESSAQAQEIKKFSLENSVSLGVDIVEIERMKKVLNRSKSFAEKVFSEEERAYCEKTSSPAIHYAARFAAKEAVLKALGTGFSEGVGVKDVEVRLNSKGRPCAVLHGVAKTIAQEQGVRDIPLSLSHTHTEAVAIAMAITAEVIKAEEKRVDPVAELTRQFKEARLILDEIDKPANKNDQSGVQVSLDFGDE